MSSAPAPEANCLIAGAPSGGDTIVAPATPPGRGGIGVIRVSGPQSRHVAQLMTGCDPLPRRARFATFRSATGEALDQGIVLFFSAPASFTGEDVLELQGHGGPVLMERLVEACQEFGCRLARPGEFSERAFLNGRLDLTQAEAIADLINAATVQAARGAMRTLEGVFSQRVRGLMTDLTAARVTLEAALDFPDEEIDLVPTVEVFHRLATLRENLDSLITDARHGSKLRQGVSAVLLGRPNVGKSSLLNRLCRRPTAIVSETPGTTRDLVRETVTLGGVQIDLTDTAGLRLAPDDIEAEGIRRAQGAASNADLILLVSEAGRVAEDLALVDRQIAPDSRVMVIENKIDIPGLAPEMLDWSGMCRVRLSARTGAGVDLLEQALATVAGSGTADQAPFIARLRHLDALVDCAAALQAAQSAGEGGAELLAEELRHAQSALGRILGEVTSEDLLGEIFSTFCIGK